MTSLIESDSTSYNASPRHPNAIRLPEQQQLLTDHTLTSCWRHKMYSVAVVAF